MRRTGYNILGEFLTPPGGDIRPQILSHLRAYRPTVITVMDNPSFAVEALETTGGETMVVHRHYHPREGYLFTEVSAETYANYITYNRTLDKRIWPQVWNEPTTAPDRLPLLLQRTMEVADLLSQWGYRAVLGNLGTATIQPETVASGVFDKYLTRLALWSMNDEHVAGYHEYTAILAPFGVGYWSVDDLHDPTKMQPENWPEITPLGVQDLMAHELGMRLNANPFISVPPESQHYWHILRLEWLQERAELIGVGRHRYVITENFLDRMGDVSNIYPYLEQIYGVTSDWEIKGAPTLENVWSAWWPQWSKDQALAEQCWWLERTYPDECIGWTLFCMCRDAHMEDKAQRWEPGYDISDWSEFQALLIMNRDVPAHPQPLPDPGPGDDEPPTDTPTAPPWLLPVMLAVCGIIVGMIIYGVFRPRLSAQGVTSMEIISITEAGNILLAAIGAILAGGLAAPVTQPVVNLLKFVLKLAGLESKVSANTLSLVVAAVVSVAIWLSRHFGMELQAANVMDWLAVALPIVLSGLSMFLSQKGMYALSQRYEIPLFGYQRSE